WSGHTRPDVKALSGLYEELGFRSLLEDLRRADGMPPQADAIKDVAATASATYGILNTVEGLRQWIAEARKAPLIGLDTETTAVDAMSAALVGISVSCKPCTGYYIPVGHQSALETTPQLSLDVVRRELGPVFADPGVKKCAQHFKYDVKILERHGFKIGGFAFDTMLAAYLLNPEKEHGLKFLARDRLGVEMTPISKLIGSGKNQITMAEIAIADAAPYAAADADLTLRLANLLRPELQREGLAALYEKIEHPLVEVLDDMERTGIKIDVAYFKRLSRELEKRLESLTAQIYEAAGHPFNINSTRQVAEVLFEELKLPSQKKGKTGYSTDVSVLEALGDMHPLPNLLVEYRANEKLKNTYVDTLPKLVNATTGKIHTSYNQTIAATGRLSSSEPNLQNIPVRTALGRQIREGFIPSEKGFVFLAADYSQIELRILAHLSGDATLKKTYLEGGDVHRLTASRIFGCSASDVSPEMRDRAKIINFGIIYGMTAHRLATDFKIDHAVAQRFIDDYFRAYPGVKQWTRQTLESAREKGFVTTLSGRRRHLPDLKSPNRNVRMNAERIAINTPIQGASADMIKLAMLRVWRRLRDDRFKSKMLLQVHDELVFEVPEGEAERVGKMVRKEMAEALPLDVPIQVDTKTGRNWGEC
ncbi:MAG: DNA polymerase I, partial [bacterium]